MTFIRYILFILLVIPTSFIFNMEKSEETAKELTASMQIFNEPRCLKSLVSNQIILQLIGGKENLENIYKLPLELQEHLKIIALTHYIQFFTFLFFPKKIASWKGEGSKVTATALSSDRYKNYSLIGLEQGTVILLDNRTGHPIKKFEGHETAVTALTFHPNEPLIASGSKDGQVKVWNIDTGESIQDITILYHPNFPSKLTEIHNLAFVHHHLHFKNHFHLVEWDLTLKELYNYSQVALDSSSNYMITIEKNAESREYTQLAIHARKHPTQSMLLREHTGPVSCSQISHDEKFAITCSPGKDAYLWDTKTGNCLEVFNSLLPRIMAVSFSPDDTEILIAACSDYHLELSIWDMTTKSKNSFIAEYSGKIPIKIDKIPMSGADFQYHIIFADLTRAIIDIQHNKMNILACPFFDPFFQISPSGKGSQKSGEWRSAESGKITSVTHYLFGPLKNIQLLIGCENGTVELWSLLEDIKLEQLIFILNLAQITYWKETAPLSPDLLLLYSDKAKKKATELFPLFDFQQQSLIKAMYPFLNAHE